MPIEIRELIIRTEISARTRNGQVQTDEKDLNAMKEKLLDDCKKIISQTLKKDRYNR